MNLRRQRPNDSLDMLLDTMCNTFGGIILLAVLVTLLTGKERQVRNGTASGSQAALQRRLAMAHTNLQKTLQLTRVLQAKADGEGQKKQMQLLSTRKEIQDELGQIREIAAQNKQELTASSDADPAERLKFLNSQMAAVQARKLEAQNGLAAAEKSSLFLRQRLEVIEKQAAAILSDSQRPLRLPREYQTGKQVIYVIARYGRIYLCRNPDLSRNETDINWTGNLDSEIAEPIPGRGLDPGLNSAGLKRFLNSQSKETIYMVFCVFEDSFPAFIRAKQITVDSGFAYGWEAFRNVEGPVSFSSFGHTPKPQ